MSDSISHLRTRLTYADGKLDFELVQELIDLGEAAVELMPLVVERFRNGRLRLVGSHVVKLYEATKDDDIVNAYVNDDRTPAFSVHEQCDLLRAGRRDFDEPLREYLHQHFSKPMESAGCVDAVQALGASGNAASEQLFEFVQDQLKKALDEQRGTHVRIHEKLHADELLSEEESLIALEAGPRAQLLECIQIAVAGFVRRWTDLEADDEPPSTPKGRPRKKWSEEEVQLLDQWDEYSLERDNQGRDKTVRDFCDQHGWHDVDSISDRIEAQ